MPEVWNKMESVCNSMEDNEIFNVTILAIPKIDITSDKDEYIVNEALESIKNSRFKVIDALSKGDSWVNLEQLNPDYVFYQRPYDTYLPEQYRSYNVIKYSKTCYIPYGWTMTKNLQHSCFNKEFFRSLYLFYAENDEACEVVKKYRPISNCLKLRKTLSLGSPSLELVRELKNESSESWERSRDTDKLRIMWTPRWTIDPNLCASNFFEYKDKFIEYAKVNKEHYLLLRPHPMAFENYIKCGLMSKRDVELYKKEIDKLENISLDKQKEYLNTFWNSDVLISDMSAIIIEYFLTGKPIIYCDNGTAPLDDTTTKLAEGFYWAKNWNEVEVIVSEIANGKDRLYNKRQELISEVLNKVTIGSTKRIVDSVIFDYNN